MPNAALAAGCANPGGDRGQIIYNSDYRVLQYCARAGWVRMSVPGPASTGCTNPAGPPGEVMYNSDFHVPQFCAGSLWRPMGPTPGAGGAGCINPAAPEGQLMFNTDYDVVQYCDGAHWIAVGNPKPDVTNGLLAWYKLDDGSGTTATDSIASPHNGSLVNGPVWTTGFVKGGLSFDGSSSYVNIPFDPALDLSGDLTLSAWIKPTSTAGIRRIVSMPRGTWGVEQYSLLLNAGALQFWLGTDSALDQSVSVPYSYTGSWHHVVGRVRGVTMSVFIDGSLQATGTFSGVRSSHYDGDMAIGRFGDAFPQIFSGSIDDVRVYNRALDDAEILQVYQFAGGS